MPSPRDSSIVRKVTSAGQFRSARESWSAAPASERASLLLDLVLDHTALVVGQGAAHALDAKLEWRRLGIYQERAHALRKRLSEALELSLPATSLFDYSTPEALTRHLEAELLGKRAPTDLILPKRNLLQDDTIAIVGMACRYPGGVCSPEDLWQLVKEGRDAVSTLPVNRGWDLEAIYDPEPGRPGKTYTREGGFLHDVDQFDPTFFGISPREAAALDPQQRVLLEIAWEAVERAGVDPTALRGSRTNVFVGIAYRDYGPSWHEPPKDFNGHLLMGALTSAASGRIAYSLGLEGAALTIDTACSSSLVALHLACQALRTGECSLALSGGATIMATPGVFLEFSSKRGLSPHGRCKSFSAEADGTGWGEGAGMLLLERLSDARRNGHRVLSIVRGTALNQDGASNGLTAPNGPAQERVILQALSNAGLEPCDVDAVEGHGTGTTLGDPIEARALLATYGRSRPKDSPLALGSLKSNIGHTQAAGAVGSVIKMVMAMEHGLLPKTLHVATPSSHVDWSMGAVSLLREAQLWERRGHPRRCGVSAFGVSGTNGHVILEEAPAECPLAELGDSGNAGPASETEEPAPASKTLPRKPWRLAVWPCILAGKSVPALHAQGARLRAHWEAHPDWELTDVARSLTGRSRFKHRAVLFAGDRETALLGLSALASEGTAPRLIRGVVQERGKLAFLFTGQGSQRAGMGRSLYEAFPPFAAAFDAVCLQLDQHLDRALRDVVFADEGALGAPLLDETLYTQTALFALEVSLFRLMQAWGVRPDVLIGHSIGELVAAHVAGVLSLADACQLVAARGRLMQACPRGGAMLAIRAPEDEVASSLVGLAGKVDIAAVNGARSTVIAGDESAVSSLAEHWQRRGTPTRRLRVSHAFHSPHMEGMLAEFQRVAESLTFSAPLIPIVSNSSGDLAGAAELTSPSHWVRHARHAVRFFDGIRTLQSKGVTAFLELGPDAVLTGLAQDCVSEEHAERAVFVSALRARHAEAETLTTALAELYVRGIEVDWRAAFAGRKTRPVELPTYAFQRQRYWLDAPNLARPASVSTAEPWRYRVVWKCAPNLLAPLTGTWLVFAGQARDQGDFGLLKWLSSEFTRSGARVHLVVLDGSAGRAQIRAELKRARAEQFGIAGALSLLALDLAPDTEQNTVSRGLAHTLALAQAWAEEGMHAPLWCLTQSAVAVRASDAVQHPEQAMVWGLGRVFGLEQPQHWGGLVDVPEHLDERTLQTLCGVLASRDGEDQCAVRGGERLVRRLLPIEAPRSSARPWRSRGTTLITGGTGAIGAHAARWLARHGAEHLWLVSRRGAAAPGATALSAELEALGVRVTLSACDLADRNAVVSLLDSVTGAPPLTAVVHAAGVSGRFASLTELELGEFASVISGKVAGARHLDALLAERHLDVFVLLSSIAGVWGSAGQAAYAAGNAFLDALAEQRRARGCAGSAIAWGPWAEDGMASDPFIRDHLLRRGLLPLPPAQATNALWEAVASGATTTTVAQVDWERFLPLFDAGRESHFFDEVRGAETAATALTPAEQSSAEWVQGLQYASVADREHATLELVLTHAAAILGHASAKDIDADARFLDLGFDSLASVELRKRLAKVTGLRLPPTLVFDHPTARGLAQSLQPELSRILQARGNAGSEHSATSIEPAHTPGTPHDEASGALRYLYRDACDRGMLDEAFELLKAAAKLRPLFRTPNALGRLVEPVRLATGPTQPALVCFPPFVAPSGQHNYARLALHLEGLLAVHAFALPGFADGDPLPDSRELILDLLTESVAQSLGETSIALIGYSSGGWFAHAVAERLEARGIRPQAVVLLDSLSLKGERWGKVRAPLRSMAINPRAFALITDNQLTAMAAYMHLFEGWKPNPIQTPIVVVRARECIPEWEGDRLTDDFWRGSWDLAHQILEVPGNHFSIINEDAPTTARALYEWLSP